MTLVQSRGRLVEINGDGTAFPNPPMRFYGDLVVDLERIWRTQPAVRTVITFLGRNIAQLGVHVYKRVSDVERERLTDHPLSLTLGRPNPNTTTYELIDSLVQDIAIYDNAYWLKVRVDAPEQINLLRLPPRRVQPIGVTPWGQASTYRISGTTQDFEFTAEQVVHFHGFNPDDTRVGVSSLESLRRLLAEEYASSQYREQLWRSGARVATVIERPANVDWSDNARERFRDEWKSLYSGMGEAVGGTPVLEDGMTLKPVGYSSTESQYVETRKLTREEVASAFHVPPPMVGILDHATYSNVTQQHKQLYQDTLGPWLQLIAQRIEIALLPDYAADQAGVYVEFNLSEKLRGSFEEQSKSLRLTVGAPIMTRNEGRARLNLPPVEDGDELIVPLNVSQGPIPEGEGGSDDEDERRLSGEQAGRVLELAKASDHQPYAPPFTESFAGAFRAHFAEQRETFVNAIKSRKGSLADIYDMKAANDSLAARLFEINVPAAEQAGRTVYSRAGFDPDKFDVKRMDSWLQINAAGVAARVNKATVTDIHAALLAEDAAKALTELFDDAITNRAYANGLTQANDIRGAGGHAAAEHAGLARKTWRVRSTRPRATHAALNGQTVPVGQLFGNGARWPSDGRLPTEERARCTCEVMYSQAGED